MATTPNYAWTTPDDTNLVKNGASNIRTLANAIDATTKTVSDSIATQVATRIPLSVIDAAGDLLIGTGSDTVARLAIGANNTVLTSNGTTATWTAPATGSLTLLSTTSLTASPTNITGISQAYQHLYVVLDTVTMASNGGYWVVNPQGANVHGFRLETLGTAPTANNQTFSAFFTLGGPHGTPTTGGNLQSTLLIENYAQSGVRKFGTVKSAYHRNTTPVQVMGFEVGMIDTTSSISQLNFSLQASATGTGTVRIFGVR